MQMLALTLRFTPSISKASAMLCPIRTAKAATFSASFASSIRNRNSSPLRQADRVAPPNDGLQSLPHSLQDLVADIVPVRIVNTLELVEVDEHHRQAPRMPLRLPECVAQPVMQKSRIWQAGYGIVKSALARSPKADHLCRGCGKKIRNERTNCAKCAVGGASERFILAALSRWSYSGSTREGIRHYASTRKPEALGCRPANQPGSLPKCILKKFILGSSNPPAP